jgi:gamma-butyrobetaine dioxygenase
MSPLRPSARISVDDVLALYEQWGLHRYDEEVTQLDHALQTAACAEADDASDALVAAALLHDVGHLLVLVASGGTAAIDVDHGHETLGAQWLRSLFPAAVTAPIGLHVRAKRYRCAIEPSYRARLSEGSTRSLVRQGGPMSPGEARGFESNLAAGDAIRLREWDDAGKVEGLAVAPLASYRPLLARLARGRGGL